MFTFEHVAGIIGVGLCLIGLLRGLALWVGVVNLDEQSLEYKMVLADMNTIRCLLGRPQQNELAEAQMHWASLLYIIPGLFGLTIVAIAALKGLPMFE